MVSIFIPLYNAEKYLSECLDSVINQTYKNIEIIIVNDGSTDDSLFIAESYVERYSFIKVYSQENSGAASARNRAFQLSGGEYIQYIDADDLLHPDKIRLQVEKLIEMQIRTLCFGRCEYFYNDKQNILKRDLNIYHHNDFDAYDFLNTMWLNAEALPPLSYLVHRSLIETVGGWNEELSNNDDGEFFARVIVASQHIVFIPESISYYRMDTPNSLSKDISRRALLSYVKSIKLYAEHIKGTSRDFTSALKTVFTRALIKLYPIDVHLAEEMKRYKEEIGIYGYRYPRYTKLYDMLFFFLGIQMTAKLQALLKRLKAKMSK